MWSRVVPCNYRVGPGIIGADSGRVIIGSSLLPGEHHDDDDGDGDDDDDGSLILPGEHDDDGKDGFLSLWTIHFCRTIASLSTPSLSTFFSHFSLSLIDHLKIPHHCFFATLPHKTWKKLLAPLSSSKPSSPASPFFPSSFSYLYLLKTVLYLVVITFPDLRAPLRIF